jgi:ABC-2 type transport system permease protein
MTAIAPARPPLAPLVAEGVFVRRSLIHSLRDPESLLMAILLPVMLMLLFTFVFGGAFTNGTSSGSAVYVNYIVPGIILLCAGFGAASTAVAVNEDLTTGMMDRFRTMPIRGAAVIGGHVVASLARNLLATGVVIGVALAVGFRPSGGPLAWLAAIALVALYILAITALFAAIGIAAGSPGAASGYGFILLFLPYLSSAFVPVDTMPAWLQPVAEHQPITPITETIRALLMGGDAGPTVLIGLAWCIGILVVATAWGSWLFGRVSR